MNTKAEKVINEFIEFSKYPHGSGDEKKVGEYLVNWARERGIKAEMDLYGNVIMEKEAQGCDMKETVILQSHMDMVCVADSDKEYDVKRDCIEIYRDGDFLKAKGTSLGADDGAGVAMMLFILSDKEIVHPPIRAIFTVEEETSMKGAGNLDVKYLDGKYLLNLDWEEKDSISSSCSNTVSIVYNDKPEWSKIERSGCEIKLMYLLGGHSGCDINLPRASAIKLAGELLFDLEEQGIEFDLCEFSAGRVVNAICAECRIVIATEKTEAVCTAAKCLEMEVKADYPNEENFQITVCETVCHRRVSESDKTRLTNFLTSVHSGVFYMSKFTPDFVETSQNIGIVKLEDELVIEILARSSSRFHSEERKRAAKAIAKVYGYTLSLPGENPIWEEKGENDLIRIMKRAYNEVTGKKLKVGGVHAGLECAFFASVKPSLQMVSAGPQLYDVHSPKERWEISSLPETLGFILRSLEIMAE